MQWPAWHDEYIRDNYANGSTNAIAAHLGRPARHVRDRAFAVGVKKAQSSKAKRVGAFSPDADEIMRRLYATHTNAELEAVMGLPRKAIAHRATVLGLLKSAETKSRTTTEALLRMPSHSGQFSKGLVPWNKGIKGYSVALSRGHFKKGNLPPTWVPVGTERWTTPPNKKPGAPRYLKRKTAEPDQWRMVHRLIWHQHHGKIPAGHVVVFKDGDTKHIAIDNLDCVPRSRLGQSNGTGVPLELLDAYRMTKELSKAIKETEKRATHE